MTVLTGEEPEAMPNAKTLSTNNFEDEIEGMVALQVDDLCIFGTADFIHTESQPSKRFPSKPPQVLTDDNSIDFNGARVSRIVTKFRLSQPEKLTELKHVTTQEEFISRKGLGVYISTMSRPDLLGDFQLAKLDKSYHCFNKLSERQGHQKTPVSTLFRSR